MDQETQSHRNHSHVKVLDSQNSHNVIFSEEFITETAVVKEGWVDIAGMVISTVCAFHCLATPFLVFAAPFLSVSFHHPLFHWIILALVGPLGALAFWVGYKHHHQKKILILGLVGISIVTFGAIAPHLWVHFLGHYFVTLAGSAFLITAHYLNRRACRCHTH